MTIISVRDLSKEFFVPKRKQGFFANLTSLFSREYVKKNAIDGISFDINEGELVGFIGPNGAGKSTTVKILSGILVPNRGKVKVLGKIPWQHRIETVCQPEAMAWVFPDCLKVSCDRKRRASASTAMQPTSGTPV